MNLRGKRSVFLDISRGKLIPMQNIHNKWVKQSINHLYKGRNGVKYSLISSIDESRDSIHTSRPQLPGASCYIPLHHHPSTTLRRCGHHPPPCPQEVPETTTQSQDTTTRRGGRVGTRTTPRCNDTKGRLGGDENARATTTRGWVWRPIPTKGSFFFWLLHCI